MDKLLFLQKDFPELIKKLTPLQKGNWGVLNGIQMVEHMADSFQMATGKKNNTVLTAPDKIQKAKEFAMSDKEFKPNTKNSTMPETPVQSKFTTIKEATDEYLKQLNAFIIYFKINPNTTIANPFFGELNYEEWIHKHAVHHFKQFALI
jgi:hypothetical protein